MFNLPTPPWAQTSTPTCSCGMGKPHRCPLLPSQVLFWRVEGEGGGGKPLLAAPSLLASQVTVLLSPEMQLEMETGDREAISCPNGLLLLPTPFISLSLPSEICVNHREPQARLCLCLGPRETGRQKILNTRLLVFSSPPPLPWPRDSARSVCKKVPDLPAESELPNPALGFGQQRTRILPKLHFKDL